MSNTASPSTAFLPQWDQALKLAAIVHKSAVRRGSAVPYVIHPVHVAAMLARVGAGEQVQTAALLHDVLEDIDGEDAAMREAVRETFPPMAEAPDDAQGFAQSLKELIGSQFGAEVLAIVEGMTEEKRGLDGRRLPYARRRANTIARLEHPATPRAVLEVKAADALHNVTSMLSDLGLLGLSMMNRFQGTAAETLDYYGAIVRVTGERLGANHSLVIELAATVRVLKRALREAVERAEASLRSSLPESSG